MMNSTNAQQSKGSGKLSIAVAAILFTQIFFAIIFFSIISTNRDREPIGSVSVLSKSTISQWANDCESPCFLPAEYRGGGNLLWFQNAAFILMDQHKQLVIDHDVCVSACTILMDTMSTLKGNVCATERVLMGIHRGSMYNAKNEFIGYFDYEYLNPVIRQFLIDELKLDPNGEVSFLASDNWSIWWPMCKQSYEKLGPAMEDGETVDHHSLP